MCTGIIQRKLLDTRALEELDAKMRLESTYRPQLSALFNRIVKDFRAIVAATGQAVDARNYRQDFDASLRTQYDRVQRFFTGRITEGVEGKIIRLKQTDDQDQALEELIAASLVAWRIDSGERESLHITNTNQHQMQDALAKARQQITEEQLPTDNRTLAAIAGAFLARFFKARVERIIVTETQSAAESTRAIEVAALSGRVPFPLERVSGVEPAVQPRRVTKTWRDIGDNVVRDSHVVADGTTIDENDIFIVGPSRSRLRFPGDMLLGAVTAEVINCRCFADYRLIRG